MKGALFLLLTTLSVVAHGQAPTQAVNNPWANEHFTPQHQQQKQKEQRAIALRVKKLQSVSNDRHEIQYAENRRRCQAALRVADLCGKYAGAFYCDAKGFQPIVAEAATRPVVVMSNGDRYRMEHCALHAARRN